MENYAHEEGPEFTAALQNTARQMRKTPPNKDYMINLLFTFNPEHQVFAKDYVKPRPRDYDVAEANLAEVRNDDGFYDGLPIYSRTGSKRARLINLAATAANPDEVKLAKLARQKEKIEANMRKIHERRADAVGAEIDLAAYSMAIDFGAHGQVVEHSRMQVPRGSNVPLFGQQSA